MSSIDRILQMVNASNALAYPLTADSVSLSDIIAEDAINHNTRVTMRSVMDSGYTGQVDLLYTRALLTALGDLVLQREQPFTYDEMLEVINQQKAAQMTANDFTNSGLPAMDTGVVTNITLSAKDTSLVWLGDTEVTFLIGIPAEASDFVYFWSNTAAGLFD